MSKRLRIRPYEPIDLTDLVILCNAAFAAYAGAPAIRREDLLHDLVAGELGEAGVLVAEYGGQLVGYTQLIRRNDPVNFLLPVLSRAADLRVTIALFDELCTLARNAGWPYLQTGFSERDLASMRLCHRLDMKLERSLESLMRTVHPGPLPVEYTICNPKLPADLPRTAALINRIFSGDMGLHPQDPASLADYFELSGIDVTEVFLIAPTPDLWLGVLIVCQHATLATQGTGSIELLGIVEEARRKGWGAKLVRQASGYFARHNCRRMETSVDSENRGGLQFYLSQGFAPVGLIHYYRRELLS